MARSWAYLVEEVVGGITFQGPFGMHLDNITVSPCISQWIVSLRLVYNWFCYSLP